jgi:hypothetical protein
VEEAAKVQIHERLVVKKVDDASQEVVEVLVVEDGIVTERYTGDEVNNAPEA